ncbi:isopentenyl-diphosphate Delta-isomerase [Tabrizicola sp.]|jgi:isopentenyl-diphosphate Delta-isomerase|uniref:isopentenyl-diphosphate Delta-isomerase n=1 Tax=Tabrizicola sp. TaxID=2005166 RepID=UPI003D2CD993
MTEMIPAWVDGTLTQVEKLEVHQRGLRHKAVSVFVMRGREVLLQRRALGKYHTPGLWANTCCTHPRWGEAAIDCAARRLAEELGITGLALQRAGGIEYRAEVGAGLTEHEVVEVFSAQAPADLALDLDPAEVMQTRWVSLETLETEVRSHPEDFTPWLRIYLAEGMAEAAV